MKRKPGLTPVERAVIAQQWGLTVAEAQIHALVGDNSQQMVNKAGRTLYVVLGACIADGVAHESPEIRILRGAVNAVHDQAGENAIPALRRESIISGLQTAAAMVPLLNRKSLVDAACDLALKLRHGNVKLSDFEAILKGEMA